MAISTKFLFGIVLIAAVIGGALYLKPTTTPQDTPAQARNALTVTTMKPLAVTWPQIITATGNIEAWQKATISAEVSGVRITEVLADVGDVVKKGQVLAKLSDETLKAMLDQQAASVAKAKATLMQAEADRKRADTLKGTGAISEQQVAEYKTTEQTAKADLALQNATLVTQQLNLNYTSIIAPDDGIIASRNASVGTIAQAGNTLFTIINQGRLEWRATVPENDIGRITDQAQVSITTLQNEPVEAKIRLIAPTIDTTTRDGMIYVDLPANAALKDGMFVKGQFDTGSKPALALPEQSIVVQNGYYYVFTLQPDKSVKKIRIQTGRRQDNQAEITEGLAETDTVVVEGAGFLNDGDKVNVTTAANATEVTP